MSSTLPGRNAQNDLLADVSFLADLTPRERNQLLPFMTEVRATAGQELIRQGALGREFFIIVEGTAEVTRDGVTVATLGPGDHFGEISLLGEGVLRAATVTATSPMKLQVQTPPELHAMLDRAPQIAQRLLRAMAEYSSPDAD